MSWALREKYIGFCLEEETLMKEETLMEKHAGHESYLSYNVKHMAYTDALAAMISTEKKPKGK